MVSRRSGNRGRGLPALWRPPVNRRRRTLFCFVSDPAFDQGYKFDFFCFEPMSRAPDDHHRPGFGQTVLAHRGESLRQKMVLNVCPL